LLNATDAAFRSAPQIARILALYPIEPWQLQLNWKPASAGCHKPAWLPCTILPIDAGILKVVRGKAAGGLSP